MFDVAILSALVGRYFGTMTNETLVAVPLFVFMGIMLEKSRIAENLLLSQQSTAHLTTFNEIDMTAVVALRERLKERVEKEHGVKLSFMPFFVKAASMALTSAPRTGCSLRNVIDMRTLLRRTRLQQSMGTAKLSQGGP